jgi:polysaccharide pyruvyl transferase WcaK-like protein
MPDFTVKSKTLMIETGDDFNLNVGDESYFAAMVDVFRERLGPIDIVKLTHDPDKMAYRYGVRGEYSGSSMLRRLIRLPHLLREINHCDVYILGGGQIICDPTILLALIVRLSRSAMALFLGKKVMSYALGVGPLHRRMSRWLVGMVFNRFTCITVRDEYSRELLRRCGVQRHIELSADPCLILTPARQEDVVSFMESQDVPPRRPGKRRIFVAPYGPAFHRKKSIFPAKWQVKWDIWLPEGRERFACYVRDLAEVCDHLVKQADAHICFVAMDASKYHGGDDVVSREVISAMKFANSTTLIGGEISAKMMLGIIGTGDLLLGSRLHSLIMACRMGIPMVGIAFEEKTASFMDILGLSDMMQRAADYDVETVKLLSQRAIEEAKRFQLALSEKLPELQAQCFENVERVRSLLAAETR